MISVPVRFLNDVHVVSGIVDRSFNVGVNGISMNVIVSFVESFVVRLLIMIVLRLVVVCKMRC